MFETMNVMTRKELEARNEVKWDTYTKRIQIEARVMGDITMNHIVPVATHYQSQLAKNVQNMRQIFPTEKADKLCARNIKLIEEIAERTQAIETGVEELVNARKVANKIENERESHRLSRHSRTENGENPLSNRQVGANRLRRVVDTTQISRTIVYQMTRSVLLDK